MKRGFCFAVLAWVLFGCDKLAKLDIRETGQQASDIFASIDQSSGNKNGKLAGISLPIDRLPTRLNPPSLWAALTMHEAYAVDCVDLSLICDSGVVSRDFGGCTIGELAITGKATVVFDDLNCRLDDVGERAIRDPDFTVTGRGATFTVKKASPAGLGQRLTKKATDTYEFDSIDGIRRVFSSASGTTVLDFTTRVSPAITVTGTARENRTANGGTVEVTNNGNGDKCTMTASNVKWSATDTCNCPSEGKLEGTCTATTGNKTITVEISGCTNHKVTFVDADGKSTVETYTPDACYAL